MLIRPTYRQTVDVLADAGRLPWERGSRGGGGGAAPAPFYPSDIAGGQWLYDAARGITLSGADVQEWADQSGRGNHASAASAGVRPVLNVTDADFNGQPSVEGDGASEWLSDAATSFLPDPLPTITTFVVMRIVTNINGRPVYGINNVALALNEVTVGRLTSRVVSNTTTCTSNITTAAIVEQFYDGATHSILINGTVQGTPAAQTGTIASGLTLHLFASMTGTTPSASKFAFHGGWTGLTAGQRTTIRDYLTDRFFP